MRPEYAVFTEALDLFHRYSLQNDETVRALQGLGVLPAVHRPGFAVLDIGAGQGHLPDLMRGLTDTLVLVEPNPRCVEVLRARFPAVHAGPWGKGALRCLRADHPAGFDLITLSHMLYHLAGIADVRAKVRLALTLLKPGGALAVVLNRRDAPMSRIGIAFEVAEGRQAEAQTNRDLLACCHTPDFYRDLAGPGFAVSLQTIDTPLCAVPSRADLIGLLRMCLLDPLSAAPCATERVDRFIAGWLDANHPGLGYPASIPSHDDLVVLRRDGSSMVPVAVTPYRQS